MNDEKSPLPVEPTNYSCPSSLLLPESAPHTVLGVMSGTPTEPRLTYLAEEVPVTQELLDMAAPLSPDAVFRFAGRCAGSCCPQFDGCNCNVAKRVVADYPEAVDTLPICRLRPTCRWWHQEGRAACLRCPQVVRFDYLRLIPLLATEIAGQHDTGATERADTAAE